MTIAHHVITDDYGIKYGLDGEHYGESDHGDSFYVTTDTELIVHGRDRAVSKIVDENELQATVAALVSGSARDAEIAGQLIEALNIDFTIQL